MKFPRPGTRPVELVPHLWRLAFCSASTCFAFLLALGGGRFPAEDTGLALAKGSAEWVHWLERIRRRTEETNLMGADTVFFAASMIFDGKGRISEQAAVCAFFDQPMLNRQVEANAEAAEVLRVRGCPGCLHNHVGSLMETEYEIDCARRRPGFERRRQVPQWRMRLRGDSKLSASTRRWPSGKALWQESIVFATWSRGRHGESLSGVTEPPAHARRPAH